MEGRAIARPNVHHTGTGRAALGLQWRAGQLPGQTWGVTASTTPTPGAFNGGPGNCPAKRWTSAATSGRRTTFNGGPGNCPAKPCLVLHVVGEGGGPSMEGRAIARPNRAADS